MISKWHLIYLLSKFNKTEFIISAIKNISESVMPREVIAGVPILIPLPNHGLFVSNGIQLRVILIPAFSSAILENKVSQNINLAFTNTSSGKSFYNQT